MTSARTSRTGTGGTRRHATDLMRRWRYAAVVGALMLSNLAQARGTCPPGKYQATPPGIPGPVVCAPIAHDRDGRVVTPPPRASHWGAIASDLMAAHVVASKDLPDKQEAEKVALASCRKNGGGNCSVAIAYGNGCGALAIGEHGLATGADVTRAFAQQDAMRQCSSHGDQHCHVVQIACSDPSSDR